MKRHPRRKERGGRAKECAATAASAARTSLPLFCRSTRVARARRSRLPLEAARDHCSSSGGGASSRARSSLSACPPPLTSYSRHTPRRCRRTSSEDERDPPAPMPTAGRRWARAVPFAASWRRVGSTPPSDRYRSSTRCSWRRPRGISTNPCAYRRRRDPATSRPTSDHQPDRVDRARRNRPPGRRQQTC